MKKNYLLVIMGISVMNFLLSDPREHGEVKQSRELEEKSTHDSSAKLLPDAKKADAPITLLKQLPGEDASVKDISAVQRIKRVSSSKNEKDSSGIRRTKRMQPPKKRILVFSSTGGGGHTSVSNGLCTYLKDTYEISVVNIFQEVVSSIDTLSTLTFGRVTGEDFYNFCMVSRWNRAINKYAELGTYLFESKQHMNEKILFDYFKYDQPDLLISVVPFINGALFEVAKKLNMPFLVVTNDFDTSNYVVGIKNPSYKKFRYTLAFEDEMLREKIKDAHIPDEQIVITGFPLRPSFHSPKDPAVIKRDFKIPDNKPVVMVFMGAAGSLMTPRFVRVLAKIDMPMHIIVCLGRNERLRRMINKIMLPPGTSISVVGFTDRIADLMSVSTVVITKTGPGSSCEALESSLPMIHDETQGVLTWERLSADFMASHGFAEGLKSFADLPALLPKYLKDSTYSDEIKDKMRKFPRKHFENVIRPLVEDMMRL